MKTTTRIPAAVPGVRNPATATRAAEHNGIEQLRRTSIAMVADVADATTITRTPTNAEAAAQQSLRPLRDQRLILAEARAMTRASLDPGDDRTADLIVWRVIYTGNTQVRFLEQHSSSAGEGSTVREPDHAAI